MPQKNRILENTIYRFAIWLGVVVILCRILIFIFGCLDNLPIFAVWY